MLKLQSSCRSGMTHTDQGSTTPLTLEFPPRGSCSTWAPEIRVNLLYFWKLELGHIVWQFQVSGQEREEKHETGAFSETPAWVTVFFISFYIWIPCELHCHSSSRAALPQSHPPQSIHLPHCPLCSNSGTCSLGSLTFIHSNPWSLLGDTWFLQSFHLLQVCLYKICMNVHLAFPEIANSTLNK